MCSLVRKSASTNWLVRRSYWHNLGRKRGTGLTAGIVAQYTVGAIITRNQGMGSKTPALVNYLLTPSAKLNGTLLFCRTNSEHLGATYRTGALSCRLSVLHCYSLSVLHFPLGTALDAVSLHIHTSSRSFALTLDHFTSLSQPNMRLGA